MLKNVLKNIIVIIILSIAVITANGCHAANQAERQRQATVSLYRLVDGEYIPFCAGVYVGPNTILTNKHCLAAAERAGAKIYYNYAHCDTDGEVAFDGTDNVLVRTCLTSEHWYSIHKAAHKDGDKVTHYGHPFSLPLTWREGYFMLSMYNNNPYMPKGTVYIYDMNVAGGDSGGPVFDSKGRLVCTMSFRSSLPGDSFGAGGCYPPIFNSEQLKEIK